MTPFFTILTNYGKTALAEALAAQKKLEIPYMAVGDGGGTYYEPVEAQTNLRNERWRGDLNDLRTDDDVQGQVIAEAVIPMGIEGDWTAREIGLFDKKGGLIAVGKYPETYIPPETSGAKTQVYINIVVKVDNVAAVQLIVDHGQVLASKLFVMNKGYGTVGSFESGLFEIKSLTNPYQLVLFEQEGALYYWGGEFPKLVPPDSTPESTGGVKSPENPDGLWISMGDAQSRIAVNKLTARGSEIYVSDYLHVSASFSDALQLAIDNAHSDNGTLSGNKVIVPAGRFRITKRHFIHEKDGLNIECAGDGATIFEVDSLLVNEEPQQIKALNGTYRGYQYSHDIAQAIFVITARRITQNGAPQPWDGAAWRLNIKGFSVECKGDAYKKVATIYAPELGLSSMTYITSSGVRAWLECADLYSMELSNINIKDCVIPVAHGIGDIRRGTSVNLQRCNAIKSEYGWSFGNLSYSSWSNVACDDWAAGYTGTEIQHFAYDLDNCQIDMNGCGCESGAGTAFGTVRFSGGSCITTNDCTFIGGKASAISSSAYQSIISGVDTVWDINNSAIIQGASTHAKIAVSGGAIVNINSVFKKNTAIGGFVKFTDFVTLDAESTVNLNGAYKVLLSLAKTTDTVSSVSGSRVSFDKIEYDTVSTITTPSTDRASIPFSGDYEISVFIDCTSSANQLLYLYVNEVVLETLSIKNIYSYTKRVKLMRGDVVSLRSPPSMSATITIHKQTAMSILKI